MTVTRARRERPEDHDQQHEDEQHRQELDLVAGVAGRLLLVDLRGDVARQCACSPAGRSAPGRSWRAARRPGRWRSSGCRRPAARARPAAPRARRRKRPASMTLATPLTVFSRAGSAGERADVGRRSAARRAGPRRPGSATRVAVPNGAASCRGVRARRAGRKELGVVVLGHAVQRGKQRHGSDRPRHPREQHQPAELDGQGTNRSEDGVDMHASSLRGGPDRTLLRACHRIGSP